MSKPDGVSENRSSAVKSNLKSQKPSEQASKRSPNTKAKDLESQQKSAIPGSEAAGQGATGSGAAGVGTGSAGMTGGDNTGGLPPEG